MSQAGPAITHLRAATGMAHRALEDDLDAIGALRDPARQPDMLQRYDRFYTGAAAVLAPYWQDLPAQADGRARLDLMDRKAGATGCVPPGPDPSPPIPHLSNVDEARGFLYVIEGSSLGGRLILRQVAQHGGPTDGLRFLDPYGADTGTVWRGVVDALEHALNTDDARARAADGALKGFAFARACLCDA